MPINTVISTKISDTGSEPITVEQAKLHAAIDYSDYDSIIPIYISAARIAIENATGLALIEKTVKQVVQLYPNTLFKLSYSPVKTFNYGYELGIDECGQYIVSSSGQPVNYGANDEVIVVSKAGIYEIEYKAGYATVPADLKLAILQMFTFIFNHRGEYNDGRLDISVEAERTIMNNKRFVI